MREFSKEEYAVRISWLIWSRVVLATFLVGTLVFFQKQYAIYSFNNRALYYILATVYALTFVYRYLVRKLQNPQFLTYLQTSIDILLVTYLVQITGGIDSGLSILYHLAIISASILLYRRGGYLAASLSSILYGAMLDMQYYNVLYFVRSQNFTAGQVFYQVFINIISFYLVAFLSSYLSERLRVASQALQEKSIDYEDLRVMQEHILRSVGSGILTIDLKGVITSWNPAAEQITGYSYDEIRERWKDIFEKSIKELFGHTDSLKERPFRFNSQLEKKDSTTALLGMTASLLKDESDMIRGIILTFQDITKLTEMEEQVRRQDRLATVGSLAAGIAHEIRNPLASLSGSIQLLQGELELKDDDRHLMDIVVRETDRLNTIITEFLEYARPRNEMARKVRLRDVLEETITLITNSGIFSNNMHVVMDVVTPLYLRGDAVRLRQVFWNLLINACQAMPDGGMISITAMPFSSVEGSTDGTEEWCEINIEDTGQGIPGDIISKIFDPFFTTKTKGTGLGLAIVYRILEDHGGTITASSEPGNGARFTVRLPLFEKSSVSSRLNGKAEIDGTARNREL